VVGSVALGLAFGAAPAAAACNAPVLTCLIGEAMAGAEALEDTGARDEVFFEIVTTLAGQGERQDALDLAARIENPATLAEAQSEVAKAEARLGHFDTATAIAFAILDSRNESVRIVAIEVIATEQARLGLVDPAFETVIGIDNPYRRSEAEARIAKAVAMTGEMDAAFRATARIATSYWFSTGQPQFKIASGLVSRSTEFDDYWFFEALVELAELQARNDDVIAALMTAGSIPDFVARSRALSGIAVAQADSGDIDGAMETARRIESAYGDLDAMIAIAGARARAGDTLGALTLARSIWSGYGADAGFVPVAVEQVRSGDLAGGLTSLSHVGSQQSRSRALAEMALVLGQGGRIADALDVIDRIVEARDRELALQALASDLARSGRGAEAVDIAKGLEDEGLAAQILIEVAVQIAAAGDLTAALKVGRSIADPMSRAIALAEIARVIP
jgi:tetratricopeptide (TPR) repeat protein